MRGLTKFGKWCEEILSAHGYEFDRIAGNGHYVFTHPGQDDFHVSGSAFDGPVRGAFLSEMRKRHPNSTHPALFQRRSGRERSTKPFSVREERGRRRMLRDAERLAASARFARPVARVAPEHTSCEDCGRRWLSDLDPLTHPCPACGGAHRIGRRAA